MQPEKKPQVKFYLTQEQYEKLRVIATEQGLSVPAVAKRLALEYLGEIDGKNILIQYKELGAKQRQIATELGRLERDNAIMAKKINELEIKVRAINNVKTST